MSDLISRQDALKPFCIAPDGTRIPEVDCDNFPVEFSVEFIKKHLLSRPSTEPKPGKWEIKTETDEYGLKRPKLVCSKCEKEPAAWDLTELFEFCPNCGADMRGADDESTI